MKIIFIYNKENIEDMNILSRVSKEFPNSLEIAELNEISDLLKNNISRTPVIIPIAEDLQGDHIKGDNVDGQLIAIASIKKWIEKEEEVIHDIKTNRLDNFIKNEKSNAIDLYTEELLLSGVI